MKGLDLIILPSSEKEDCNHSHTAWRDGKCVALDEGTHVQLYIGHTVTALPADDGGERAAVVASVIRVPKPMTRDSAINAAEMQAYGLSSPMDVAAFAHAMARKHRCNPADHEVLEHDAFIESVKAGLTEIGVK